MQWLNRLLKRNRGEGPKPSGVSIWRVADIENVASDLVGNASASDEWSGLRRELKGRSRGEHNPDVRD